MHRGNSFAVRRIDIGDSGLRERVSCCAFVGSYTPNAELHFRHVGRSSVSLSLPSDHFQHLFSMTVVQETQYSEFERYHVRFFFVLTVGMYESLTVKFERHGILHVSPWSSVSQTVPRSTCRELGVYSHHRPEIATGSRPKQSHSQASSRPVGQSLNLPSVCSLIEMSAHVVCGSHYRDPVVRVKARAGRSRLLFIDGGTNKISICTRCPCGVVLEHVCSSPGSFGGEASPSLLAVDPRTTHRHTVRFSVASF